MRVVLGVVRELVVPVILGTLYIDRSVEGIVPPDWNIITLDYKLVPAFAVNNAPEGQKKKAQDVTFMKEDIPCLVPVLR